MNDGALSTAGIATGADASDRPRAAPGVRSRSRASAVPDAPGSGTSARTADTVILVRATNLDDRVLEFADELGVASGLPVHFLVDERAGPVPHRGRSVVGLNEAACQALGLWCPPDFAWRCGDYGYSLARRMLPRATLYWMIEYDVRFSGDRLAEFFAFFARQTSVDFLATGFEKADWNWYWSLASRGRRTQPYRCLFPITRLSAAAIDAVHARRVAHSARLMRRTLWPNDEALVATTLGNGGFACRDFNDFGRRFYDPATFSYTDPIDGDAFPRGPGDTRMFHPVLFGAQYEEKLRKLKRGAEPVAPWQSYARRIVGKVNSLSSW